MDDRVTPTEEVLRRLVSTNEAARLAGLKPQTLRQQLHRDICPWRPYKLRVGGRTHLRWDVAEIAESLVRRDGGAA